jgi:hypothetical protein
MPYGDAGTYWALLGPGLTQCGTDYDLDSAAARSRATAEEAIDYMKRAFERRSGEGSYSRHGLPARGAKHAYDRSAIRQETRGERA